MDTAPSPQLNKPAFGTSDFAVSQLDSREYIDATAEETCPADSIEPRADDDAAEAPSAASLEVMDQLKALAHNVTQGNRASFDESDTPSIQSSESEDVNVGGPGEPQAPEPSISVLPRPTGFESKQAINDKPKFGGRILALTGFAVAAAIGAGSTFALQDHLKSDDLAKAAPAPVAAAPAIPPYLGTRLEELAKDVSSVQRGMEALAAEQKRLAALQQQLEQLTVKQQLLAAKQEQAGQSIAKLHTLEQARQRTPAPVQTRPAPVPSRAYVPPPPVEPAAPPPPPQTASHPIPPLPVPLTR